jgi:hypothetical protein
MQHRGSRTGALPPHAAKAPRPRAAQLKSAGAAPPPHAAKVALARAASPSVASALPSHPAKPATKIAQPARAGVSGGKGGLGYTSIGLSYTEDEIDEAMARTDLTSGTKGHGKGKSSSGQSRQTQDENDKVVSELRKIRVEKKKAKKPQPIIKQKAPSSVFDKALEKAKSLKAEGLGLGEFVEYLDNRKIELTDEEFAACSEVLA